MPCGCCLRRTSWSSRGRAKSRDARARRAAKRTHWRDPWIALAALEEERRGEMQRRKLARLGAPVIASPEAGLQEAIFAEYERLRRRRRI